MRGAGRGGGGGGRGGGKNNTENVDKLAFSHLMKSSWGTVDAEIKVRSVVNPQLTNVSPLKPRVYHF